jgi:hypothetical protein|tara:strand:- start:2828 stop:3085 length:258 start_codon:yes stop_codon:yes gene_type:complete
MMNHYSIELSRALRILTYRYPVYLLILIVGFLLQRRVLVDIPLANDEGRIPLKFTDINITVNALFHSFVLVFVIYLIEIFYKECL